MNINKIYCMKIQHFSRHSGVSGIDGLSSSMGLLYV